MSWNTLETIIYFNLHLEKKNGTATINSFEQSLNQHDFK